MARTPDLFGIPATGADVVAIIRRGSPAWTHVGRWDITRRRYEPGAWIKGKIFPQRCDLSPDGRYLSYAVNRPTVRDAAWSSFVGVSRLPWLHTLLMWPTYGTWWRGVHFDPDPQRWEVRRDPMVGDPEPLRRRYGLVETEPATFAVERRRGWTEVPGVAPRDPADVWDQERADVRVCRARPAHRDPAAARRRGPGLWLHAGGRHGASRNLADQGADPARYELRDGPAGQLVEALDGVRWADWSHDGDLLVATAGGQLQIRQPGLPEPLWQVDLAGLRRVMRPAPRDSREW